MVRGSATAAVLASSFALSCICACSDNPLWSGFPEPEAVRKAFEAPSAAGGVIHVHQRGAFVMRPGTQMCVVDRLALDAKEKQENACVRQAGYQPIVIEILQKGGDAGELHRFTGYKLVLAAWQTDPFNGGALWVGQISREAGSLNPNAAPTVDAISSYTGTRTQMLEYNSVGWDIFALSRAFVRDLADQDDEPNAAPETGGPTAGKRDKVAEFASFLSDRRIVSPYGSEEDFRRGGKWAVTFEGVDIQRASGTWNVSQGADGLLILCRATTDRGFSPRQVRLARPETECSIVKPYYSYSWLIDLSISPGGKPHIARVPPQHMTDPSR